MGIQCVMLFLRDICEIRQTKHRIYNQTHKSQCNYHSKSGVDILTGGLITFDFTFSEYILFKELIKCIFAVLY